LLISVLSSKHMTVNFPLVPLACYLLLAGLACQPTEADQSLPSEPGSAQDAPLQVIDSAVLAIIPADAKLESLASGFAWSEGPLWLPQQQQLLFSDVPRNLIYAWQEGDSAAQGWLGPSGYTGTEPYPGEPGSNGLALDRDGHLLLCQHGDHRVARLTEPLSDPAPTFQTLAASYQGQRLNSPNDLCLNAEGQIFFTDPPYGLPRDDQADRRALDFQGVYRIDPDGSLTLLIDSLSRPNGIALSPDERTLYVANSDPERARWMAYRLDADGEVRSGRLWYDATAAVAPDNPGLPDGLKVDARGNVLATGPGGLWIFSPAGKLLGKVRTGLPTSNCALAPGYVYLTADSLLLRIKRMEPGEAGKG